MTGKDKKKYYRTENKYDPYLIKDTISSYVSDHLKKKKKFTEDHKFSNFKCVLGIIIVINVVLSHFHSIPWPQDYNILIACVLFYYISTFIYQIYEKKVEEEIFFLYTKEGSKQQYGFSISMPLYTETAEMRLVTYPQKAEMSKKSLNISNYFDEDGYIHKQSMKKLLNEMLTDADRKKNQ